MLSLRTLLNLLLPQSCALCRAPTGNDAPVCADCSRLLPTLPTERCPRCGDRGRPEAPCGHCLRAAPAFDRVFAAYAYAAPLDQLILRLKFGHQLALARWCGDTLAGRLPAGTAYAAIVPLPLHPDRLRERGFNQAVEIARPLARRLQVPLLAAAVERPHPTTPQLGLHRDERLRNLRGAFECRVDFSGQRLLIVDDVMTTGASTDELARTLKKHGAVAVDVAVVARTLAK